MVMKPTCIGAGLVVLDVIYGESKKKPNFLAGGSCGNVLTILSYLGWNSYPVIRLGDDTEGNRIVEDMKRWNVKTKFIEHDSKISSPRIIERVVGIRKPRHRFYLKCDHRNWLPRRRTFRLESLDNIQNKLPKSQVFYFDRASPSALKLAKTLKNHATIIFEPPKFLQDKVFLDCLQIADIVKHCYDQSKDTENSGIIPPLEIQTKGKEGLRYKSKSMKDWKHMDAITAPFLIDAAGSGDWLTDGLIYMLHKNKLNHLSAGKKLEEALNFGQALASLNCRYVGARGIMYNLSKQQLSKLASKITKNKHNSIEINNLPIKNSKISSKLASKCKVCLCTN